MGRSSIIQTNFTAGELSKKLMSRVDIAKYNNGCTLLQNFIVMAQGGITRRPGYYFVLPAKYADKDARLVPFKFSTLQAYVIEMGDAYFRFFKDHGVILGTTEPYEVTSPYSEVHLRDVKWAQSTDVLYMVHKDLPPKKLTRTAHNAWTITNMDFQDGPYLDNNTTSTTLTPSGTAVGSSITINASSTTNINNGSGFLSTDIGRLVRIKNGSTWGNAKITAVGSTTSVTATVKDDFADTSANATWALGLWSDTTGWPQSVAFYEDRLWFGGCKSYPQTVVASMSGAYETYSPTQNDNSVVADSGLSYTLSTDDVNAILWMSAGKVLSLLTTGGEFTVSASNLNEAITPTNIKVVRETNRGCSTVRPVRIDSAVLFWQRSGRKLREYSYDYQNDTFKAPDMTILSEHISRSGILDMDYQQEPYCLLWSARNDGLQIALTYNREQEVTGWHRHPIGGTDAKVIANAVIPSPDGTYDELWSITERMINGATVKYVEFLTGEVDPELEVDNKNYFFVDCGLTYSGSPTKHVSGLTHLIGETVSVLADGAVRPDCVVSAEGTIDLDKTASIIHIGLRYKSAMHTVNWETGGNEGTSQGKIGRIHKLVIRFLNSLGCWYGAAPDNLEELSFRSSSMPMDSSPPLFTGDKVVAFNGGYDTQRVVYIETDQPYPCTVLGLMPSEVVYG